MDKKPLLGSQSRTRSNWYGRKTKGTILSKKKRYSKANLEIKRNKRTAEKARIDFWAHNVQYKIGCKSSPISTTNSFRWKE